MPAFINFYGVVQDIIETDRSLVTFNAQVNLGDKIGTVNVCAFASPNLIDKVRKEDVIQAFGVYVVEDGVLKVRATQLLVISEGDVDIRPANVVLIGEADKGKLLVEQYLEKKNKTFEVEYEANEAATKNVSQYLKKGKLAIFSGTVMKQEGFAVKVNEIQLLALSGPTSPSSKDLLGKVETIASQSPKQDGRRTSKRKINFALESGSAVSE